MITKKMIRGMIDLIGVEYHQKITNKEWEKLTTALENLYERPSRHGVEHE